MTEEKVEFDAQFYQLVIGLHGAAMQQMGKVSSPLTGKIERDIDQAKGSIDLLEMVARKTKGNLTDEEQKLIDHVLYELRLNFLDEAAKKEDSGPQPEQPASPGDVHEDEAKSDNPETGTKE